jgi:2-polyprenyl-6-methoxyphenol hydroxylase-like FAD-dependent oxidoreductase
VWILKTSRRHENRARTPSVLTAPILLARRGRQETGMRVVFVGGGIAGLCGAMMLARDGHRVVVLERDAAPAGPPSLAWDSWLRRGVAQFRLPHGFQSRFRQQLDGELPEVVPALEAAGALRHNRVTALPTAVSGGVWPGDERFDMVTGRRPLIEAVLARLAAREPGVEIRRGIGVRGVIADTHGAIPHIRGVETHDGEAILGDLIVDAGGRRSALPDWLQAIGGQRPDERRAAGGFVYYARHFRSSDRSMPQLLAPPLQHYHTVSIATLPADNGWWSVVLFARADDTAMRAALNPTTWTRVVRAYPLASHWTDAEVMTGVDVMAKIEDRIRRYFVDGSPVATGIVAVGDAAACTSPSVGRGASIALLHVGALRDVLRGAAGLDQRELVTAFHHVTERDINPLVDDTLSLDRHRLAQIAAELAGQPYQPPDRDFRFMRSLTAGAGRDPVLLRATMSIVGLLDRWVDIAARPDILDRIQLHTTSATLPGPDRDGLIDLLTSHRAAS